MLRVQHTCLATKGFRHAQIAYDNQLPPEADELSDEQINEIRKITLHLIEEATEEYEGLTFSEFLADNEIRIRSAIVANENGIDLSTHCFAGLFNDFREQVQDKYLDALAQEDQENEADMLIQQMESDHEHAISAYR